MPRPSRSDDRSEQPVSTSSIIPPASASAEAAAARSLTAAETLASQPRAPERAAETGAGTGADAGADPKPKAKRTLRRGLRRLRLGNFPPVPAESPFPWGNERPELERMSHGERAMTLVNTRAWQQVMRPLMEQVDRERPTKGPRPAYTSEELEIAILYQRVRGLHTWVDGREKLAGDREGPSREALGFDRPRGRVGRNRHVQVSLDGVPNEPTIWRHLQRVGEERHAAAYAALHEALVSEHFDLHGSELRAEARILNVDGSQMRSHYTSEARVNRVTGEVKPPTLTGGGFTSREDNAEMTGHGFVLVSFVTASGLALDLRVVPLGGGGVERETATAILNGRAWRETVQPRLDQQAVGVLNADSAYSNDDFRRLVRGLGYLENCHKVSHADRDSSHQNAATHNDERLPIENKPNWRVNGHMELFCACGEGRTLRRVERPYAGGPIVARLEGDCPTCGPVSLTSGKWRRAQNPAAIRKVLPGEDDRAQPRWGNPLTFNDPLSLAYGNKRFAYHEGWHGALHDRFGLLLHKSWHRALHHAQRDVLQASCLQHALAITQRTLRKERERDEIEAAVRTAVAGGAGSRGLGAGAPGDDSLPIAA